MGGDEMEAACGLHAASLPMGKKLPPTGGAKNKIEWGGV